MSLFDRIKDDKVAVATGILLIGAMLAKSLQAGMLHLLTEMYPLTSENLLNTAFGIIPVLMLLIYLLEFYKTEKTQLLLCCTFVVHLAITALYAWEDYQSYGGDFQVDWVFSNAVWLAYYAFLIYVTYKGFDNINAIRIMMGVGSAYSVISSTVTLYAVWRVFPEETVVLYAQLIAIVGNLCYYLATFLIVPKVVKEI